MIDMRKQPLAMKTIAVPDCQVGEDVVFSQDNRRWFLTCMGSQAMIVGDARPTSQSRRSSSPSPTRTASRSTTASTASW